MGRSEMKTYEWKAVKLYEAYSLPELEALRQIVITDPKSLNPEHLAGRGIDIYTKPARRKLDSLAWAVTYHLKDKKAALSSPTGEA